jgi:hypothetical protein
MSHEDKIVVAYKSKNNDAGVGTTTGQRKTLAQFLSEGYVLDDGHSHMCNQTNIKGYQLTECKSDCALLHKSARNAFLFSVFSLSSPLTFHFLYIYLLKCGHKRKTTIQLEEYNSVKILDLLCEANNHLHSCCHYSGDFSPAKQFEKSLLLNLTSDRSSSFFKLLS